MHTCTFPPTHRRQVATSYRTVAKDVHYKIWKVVLTYLGLSQLQLHRLTMCRQVLTNGSFYLTLSWKPSDLAGLPWENNLFIGLHLSAHSQTLHEAATEVAVDGLRQSFNFYNVWGRNMTMHFCFTNTFLEYSAKVSTKLSASRQSAMLTWYRWCWVYSDWRSIRELNLAQQPPRDPRIDDVSLFAS